MGDMTEGRRIEQRMDGCMIVVAAIVPALHAVDGVDRVMGRVTVRHGCLKLDSRSSHVKMVGDRANSASGMPTTSKRQQDVLDVPLQLDPAAGNQSLQVNRAIRSAIIDGRLTAGLRLPSSRPGTAAWVPQRDHHRL